MQFYASLDLSRSFITRGRLLEINETALCCIYYISFPSNMASNPEVFRGNSMDFRRTPRLHLETAFLQGTLHFIYSIRTQQARLAGKVL